MNRSKKKYVQTFEEIKRETYKEVFDEERIEHPGRPKTGWTRPQNVRLEEGAKEVDSPTLDPAMNGHTKSASGSLKPTPVEVPSERFSKDDGCEDSRDLDGEDQGGSAEAVPRPMVILSASMHTLPLNSDSPEKAASNRPESLELSSGPQTMEADGNVHSDERALHVYLEQNVIFINELLKDIDEVPRVLPPSDRETIRGILHQAHNFEKEQLVVKHGPAAVASADQIFQQYLEGVSKRLVNKHSNHHGQSGPSPASPASNMTPSSDTIFMNSASSEIRPYSFIGWESDLEEKRRKKAKSRAAISDDDVKRHEIDAIDETHDHAHGHGGDGFISDVSNDEHEDGGGESTVNDLLALWTNLPPTDDVEAEEDSSASESSASRSRSRSRLWVFT